MLIATTELGFLSNGFVTFGLYRDEKGLYGKIYYVAALNDPCVKNWLDSDDVKTWLIDKTMTWV